MQLKTQGVLARTGTRELTESKTKTHVFVIIYRMNDILNFVDIFNFSVERIAIPSYSEVLYMN